MHTPVTTEEAIQTLADLLFEIHMDEQAIKGAQESLARNREEADKLCQAKWEMSLDEIMRDDQFVNMLPEPSCYQSLGLTDEQHEDVDPAAGPNPDDIDLGPGPFNGIPEERLVPVGLDMSGMPGHQPKVTTQAQMDAICEACGGCNGHRVPRETPCSFRLESEQVQAPDSQRVASIPGIGNITG